MSQILYNFDSAGRPRDSLEIEVLVSEEPQFSAEVTEFPVEKGADISDNVRPKPMGLRIEGIVSNWSRPLSDNGLRWDPSSRRFSRLLEGVQDRRGDVARDVLTRLHATGAVVSVELGQQDNPLGIPTRVHERMAFAELAFPRNSSTGDALRFSATLRQVNVVETKFGAPRKAKSNMPRANGKTKNGKLPKVEADEEEGKKLGTAFNRMAGGREGIDAGLESFFQAKAGAR